MTRGTVNVWISRAKRLLGDGDCSAAQTAVSQAWGALGQYSAMLARQGASNGTALYLHKVIANLQTKVTRQCRIDPDALAPVYQNAMDPDALAPMHGVGDEIYDRVTTTLTTLGMAAAVFGLGYGVWMTYKRS